jgi:hypothetical protein
MTQYAAANETVWPSANDVAPTLGNGKLLLERRMTPWRLGTERNYIVSGGLGPSSSTNLDISMPTVTAIINGYYVNVPGSTTVTCINGTNYIYLMLNRDGNGKVISAAFDRIASEFTGPDYCLLMVAQASAGIVTHTVDARHVTALPTWFGGVSATAAGSSYAKEGYVFQLGNTSMGGLKLYSAFLLGSGITITQNQSALVIIADRAIDIGGTIHASAAGGPGGAGGAVPLVGTTATDQPGGGGGGNGAGISGARGGDAGVNGVALNIGGSGGAGAGNFGTQVAGVTLMRALGVVMALGGAAGGGGGGGSTGGAGGTGGGSIVLIAPIVRIRSAAVFITNGTQGVSGATGNAGGGGGGAAGNVWIITKAGFFQNDGATFTQLAGTGGAAVGSGSSGGSGQTGVKQFLEI